MKLARYFPCKLPYFGRSLTFGKPSVPHHPTKRLLPIRWCLIKIGSVEKGDAAFSCGSRGEESPLPARNGENAQDFFQHASALSSPGREQLTARVRVQISAIERGLQLCF